MKRILWAWALCLLTGLASAGTDLRVLIDVSGSMKSNDPSLLRKPAAELIARLLPANSSAGVWLFGTRVRSLVDYGDVNNTWRNQTLASSEGISSNDLFTDIEAALQEGLAQPVIADRACNVILVTDGLLDLAAGPAAIRDSRARVETEITAQAARQGCRIHALGLSDNADLALLERLAAATGGLSASLQGAGELIPVLLQALEIALPNNQLPVSNNRFVVDGSVDAQTIIGLKPEGSEAPALQLISPSGLRLSPDNLPEGVEFRSTPAYDLYQITSPEAGEWTVIGRVDRVFVTSDIGVRLIDFPATVEIGQPINLVAAIENENGALDTLTLDSMQLTGQLSGPQNEPLSFTRDGARFTATLPELEAGDYRIDVTAQGLGIERSLSRALRVIAPQAAVTLETGTTAGVTDIQPSFSVEPSTASGNEAPQAEEAQALLETLNKPTDSGLTLTQWLWIIGLGLLLLLAILAYVLSKGSKT